MYSPSDKHILVMADNLKTRVSLMLSHFYVSRISFFFFCESMVPLVYLMQNICSHWCRDDNLILIKQKSTGIRVLSSSSVKSPPPPKKVETLIFLVARNFSWNARPSGGLIPVYIHGCSLACEMLQACLQPLTLPMLVSLHQSQTQLCHSKGECVLTKIKAFA